VDRLLDQGHTGTDIASVLLAMLHERTDREGEEILEDKPDWKPREGGKKNERGDRNEREDRGPRKKREFSKDAEEGMTRLFLNMGKASGLLPKDIAGLLYNEGNLPRGAVGRIHMFPKHCLVEVRSDVGDDAIALSQDAKLRGKPFRMDYDRHGGDQGGKKGPKKEK
jgi:ATP-dependent RNA helicase DeaD